MIPITTLVHSGKASRTKLEALAQQVRTFASARRVRREHAGWLSLPWD